MIFRTPGVEKSINIEYTRVAIFPQALHDEIS